MLLFAVLRFVGWCILVFGGVFISGVWVRSCVSRLLFLGCPFSLRLVMARGVLWSGCLFSGYAPFELHLTSPFLIYHRCAFLPSTSSGPSSYLRFFLRLFHRLPRVPFLYPYLFLVPRCLLSPFRRPSLESLFVGVPLPSLHFQHPCCFHFFFGFAFSSFRLRLARRSLPTSLMIHISTRARPAIRTSYVIALSLCLRSLRFLDIFGLRLRLVYGLRLLRLSRRGVARTVY